MQDSMERNVFNRGEITKDDLVMVSKKNIFKSTLSFSIVGIIILLIGLILLISFFVSKDYLMLAYALVLIVSGGLIVGLPFVIMALAPNIMAKQNRAICNGFVYKYTFTNDTVDVTLVSDGSKTHTSLKYDLIYKVNTFDDIAVIYLNSSVVYMMKMSGFENESDKDFAMSKIDKKYKVKNNE